MKYPGYSEMKDSGIDWIGVIPKSWKTSKIKYITKCLDNKRIPLNSEERAEIPGNYPYYGANGVVDYVSKYIFDDEIILLGEDGAPFTEKSKDVAFLINERCWVNNHAHILNPTKVNSIFLTNAFNCVNYGTLVGGSTREKLTQQDMNNIVVPLPSFDEQEAIADFLDKETGRIDQLIDKKEQLIELLQEKRQALISHAVTKGLDSDVPMKDSAIEWLGEIPEHWEHVKLKHVAKVVLGKMLQNDNTGSDFKRQYLKAKNIYWSYLNLTEVEEMWFSKNELKKYRLNRGDLLVCEGGEVGRTTIWNNELNECYIQNSVHKITFLRKNISRYYLYLFELYGEKRFFESIVNQVSISHLTREKLIEVPVLLPPKDEQQQIIEYLDKETSKIDNLTSKIKKQISNLKEYRQALISNAVTGKIDVREVYDNE